MMKMKHTFVLTLATLILAVGIIPAPAADYPNKPIQVIVPWAAGGGHDITARIVAEGAKKHLSKPMVITNLTGASGLNAFQKVLTSPADGYTILWEHPINLITTPAIAKAKYGWKDFDIIGSIGSAPLAVFAKADTQWKDINATVDAMRTKPNEIRWCTTPNSASGFILYAIQEASGGFKPLIIPAQSDKNRIISVLGGNSDIATAGLAALIPYMKSGDVKVLAVCSQERSPIAPEIPTLLEQGINTTTEFMFSILVPKGTPANEKKILAGAIKKTVSEPETNEALAQLGIVAKWRDAEEASKIWEESGTFFMRLAKNNDLIK